MFDREEYMKKWEEENKEYRKKYRKQYYRDNLEKYRELGRQWRKNNLGKIKKYFNQWQKNNREDVREYKKKWMENKYKTDSKFNLNLKITRVIRKSLKGNKAGRKWETLVGYTLDDLIKRLKKTMPEGYTWQDFLTGKLHIDHIIPISAFNFTRPEHNDFKRCWALSNLRLLPAKENLRKHNHLDRPFQPALRI